MGTEKTGQPEALAVLRSAAAARRAAGLGRTLSPRARATGASGDRAGRDTLLDLASNDYLGLAADPRLAEAAAAAARDWGPGSTGSRLVTGTTELHTRLEDELAAFTQAPRGLVFSSGYLANLAVVTALAQALGQGRDDAVLIVSDAANHASLIDACRLARARGVRVEVTPHADVAAVERVLAGRAEPFALVVTDTVFSVAGDLAPLRDLHRVATDERALLVLDEAHAFGVLGPGGRGAAAAAGITGDPHVVRTFTLSKSLGGQGGAVTGPAEVIETLIDVGRAFIFDTGLAPPSVAAARAALAILRDQPGLGGRARANARRLATLAAGLGFPVSDPAGAVVRVLVGEPGAAVLAQRICADHGVRVGCFRPPSVPPGQACLRLTARANLSEVHLELAFRALGVVRDHVRITA
ncbi:MAG TPA: 8-amino-7-oxononanoate synthase [Streptosporangiaceae bacterium]|nr:8-amino-7-oxononanoate synthase [Streptosporangiaceae bacterium]